MKNIFKSINGEKLYFIAEAGINHNGSLSIAKKMVREAKKAGADCIKFQNFVAKDYISQFSQKAKYQKSKKFSKKTQMEIIQETEIGKKNTKLLIEYCKKIKIDFLTTPFEVNSLDFLMQIKLKTIKVSSCNLNNYPFLEHLSKYKVPTILSTGMANFNEVINAYKIFNKKKIPVALMQCTSNYPSDIKNSNTNVIKLFTKKFNCPIGYSDHTSSNISAMTAVALGATFFEKHFTLSRKMPGIDQAASIEPNELKKYIADIKEAHLSLGSETKNCLKEEIDTKNALRRSIHAKSSLMPGKVLSHSDIIMKRPGTGLDSSFINKILGKKVKKKIKIDTKILLSHLKK